MQETNNESYLMINDDEFNLQELFQDLVKNKWIFFSVTALFSIIGLIYSLLLPNIYESKALLVSTDQSSDISASMQNYSGLAGLAGINLPSTAVDNNSTKALKTLTSLSFFEKNIMPNIFLPDLMAFHLWDHEANELFYDDVVYNKSSNLWVREYSYPFKQVPSAQESFKVFTEEHLNITTDEDTGFITLKIKHQSPYIAKSWADILINEVNRFYREKDKSEAERIVSYLNEQISLTNLSEVKLVITELLKQEMQKLALIEAKQYYVFDFIDPPAVMEESIGPKRALILILSIILGGMLGISVLLIKYYFKDKLTPS